MDHTACSHSIISSIANARIRPYARKGLRSLAEYRASLELRSLTPGINNMAFRCAVYREILLGEMKRRADQKKWYGRISTVTDLAQP